MATLFSPKVCLLIPVSAESEKISVMSVQCGSRLKLIKAMQKPFSTFGQALLKDHFFTGLES